MARQPDDTTAAKFKSSDSALIRELALLLDETSLTEIEIERAGLRVRVARNISIAASMPANFQPAAAAPAAGAPVDAADVRKVMLEETPEGLAMNDPKVVAARKVLFGSWEANWLAYNFAHDIELPGSNGPRLPFLMYPQAETANARLDCLDFASLKYTITARELTSA